jgi:hypothetical protein
MAVATLPRRRPSHLAKRAFLGTLAALSVLLAAGALSFATPSLPAAPEEVTFPLAQLPEETPALFSPFNMGRSKHGLPYGIWLVRDESRVLAFYSREPGWRECALELLPRTGSASEADSWFIAGSIPSVSAQRWRECTSFRWTRTGAMVMGGGRDLDSFDAAVRGDEVRIDVTRLRVGNCAATTIYPYGCPYSTPGRARYEETHWPVVPRP